MDKTAVGTDAIPSPSGARIPGPTDLILRAVIPGALMYQRTYPPGVPDCHSARSAHLHATAQSSAFSAIPKEEKDSLFESITKTLRRSEYHRLRYADLRRELDQRRKNLPGPVFWDEFAETLHFELQAFCGAARMLLDELIYLIARRGGIPPNKAKQRPWETAKLFQKPLPPECQVPEIAKVVSKDGWFDLLNAYRNSFFHHGWRHGSGHFPTDDLRGAATNPAANALLVPDRASLAGRSKPNDWTYKDRTTIDDVMDQARIGLDELLRELCEDVWATAEPAPGLRPRAEQPNIIVTLAKPVVFFVHNLAVIPFFTTAEAGRLFGCPINNVELVDLPVATSVVGQPAVSFSINGLDQVPESAEHKSISLLIDPVVKDTEWRNIECAAKIDLDVHKVLEKPLTPVNLPVAAANVERLFAWTLAEARSW